MPTSYISHIDYTNSPTGLEYTSLLGNSMRLSSAVAAGATTLPITMAGGLSGTTYDLNQFDPITIYDGPNSEVVLVATAVTFPTSSISIMAPIGATYTGCQYAHSQYVPCSSPGTQGDLGAEILKASAWVDTITKQSLWNTTQTETLRIPTMRASFDNQGILTFRTKQYPITAINTLQIGPSQGNFTSYDATQAFIDSNEIITVPVLNATGGSSTWPLFPQQVSRTSNAYLQVNYAAGFTSMTMPADIRDAAILLTSSQLSRRHNPMGADNIKTNVMQLQAAQRGDNTGENLLIKQAEKILSNYTLRMF